MEYYSALRKIGQAAYSDIDNILRNSFLKPIFLRGLKPEIRNALKYREFHTLTEALTSAQCVKSATNRRIVH